MRNFLAIALILFTSMTFAQLAEVKGQVLDAEFNEEPLAFAQVKVKGLDLEVITDENGNYELELSPGSYDLEIGFIGYETRLISANVEMNSSSRELDTVVLESKKYLGENGILLSDNSLTPEQE